MLRGTESAKKGKNVPAGMRQAPGQEVAPRPAHAPTDETPRPSVLVVDDNTSVTTHLAKLLTHAGYGPVTFNCGAEILSYDGAAPAAAVVDIHLPDISGLVLSHKLRERWGPEVPIIVVSGDTSMETINSLPHVGATYFFSKPVNFNALLDRLREWVA